MGVMAGPTKRELDHMCLAHDDTELTAQGGHQRPVAFRRISRQPAARPGESGIPGGGEEVRYWAFQPKWTHSEGRDSEESKFTAAHLKCSRRRPRIAGKGGCAGTPECRGDPRRDGFLTVGALLPRRMGAGYLRMGSALKIGATKSPFDAGIVTESVA